jgi:hypothetical protein
MDSIYCSDQIEVPEALPGILKAYTKEVIRFGPPDIVAFSRDYFAALAAGGTSFPAFVVAASLLSRRSPVCSILPVCL